MLGQRTSLLRVANEFVVELDHNASLASLSQQGGPLASYPSSAHLSSDLISFTSSQPVTEPMLAGLDAQGGVAWAGFAYVNAATGQRVWTTDEVIVSLNPGNSPAAFFSHCMPIGP